ncbi:hypothetical protein EJ06DRAFT_93589 [Trichodelitschia bisporula]|uniref:Uncharacterized protein n=1 Tax=Trichodelitschia bisporula TaxID=703511 RepID=A0A6G1HSQ6_9PEZI|nr:hypothetical protein EJ06DRAFT_93589 [Trichodelitschia bisporula]
MAEVDRIKTSEENSNGSCHVSWLWSNVLGTHRPRRSFLVTDAPLSRTAAPAPFRGSEATLPLDGEATSLRARCARASPWGDKRTASAPTSTKPQHPTIVNQHHSRFDQTSTSITQTLSFFHTKFTTTSSSDATFFATIASFLAQLCQPSITSQASVRPQHPSVNVSPAPHLKLQSNFSIHHCQSNVTPQVSVEDLFPWHVLDQFIAAPSAAMPPPPHRQVDGAIVYDRWGNPVSFAIVPGQAED